MSELHLDQNLKELIDDYKNNTLKGKFSTFKPHQSCVCSNSLIGDAYYPFLSYIDPQGIYRMTPNQAFEVLGVSRGCCRLRLISPLVINLLNYRVDEDLIRDTKSVKISTLLNYNEEAKKQASILKNIKKSSKDKTDYIGNVVETLESVKYFKRNKLFSEIEKERKYEMFSENVEDYYPDHLEKFISRRDLKLLKKLGKEKATTNDMEEVNKSIFEKYLKDSDLSLEEYFELIQDQIELPEGTFDDYKRTIAADIFTALDTSGIYDNDIRIMEMKRKLDIDKSEAENVIKQQLFLSGNEGSTEDDYVHMMKTGKLNNFIDIEQYEELKKENDDRNDLLIKSKKYGILLEIIRGESKIVKKFSYRKPSSKAYTDEKTGAKIPANVHFLGYKTVNTYIIKDGEEKILYYPVIRQI